MTETPQERAKRLMLECDTSGKAHYTKGEVKLLLNNFSCMSGAAYPADAPDAEGCRAPTTTDTLRRGDVFIARHVGGKTRPWCVLRVSGETVVAMALSSGQTVPGQSPSQCRYWPGSYIGGTVTTFTLDFARQEVTRPYTAAAHLRATERETFEIFGATTRRRKAPVARLSAVRT